MKDLTDEDVILRPPTSRCQLPKQPPTARRFGEKTKRTLPRYLPPVRRTGKPSLAFVTISRTTLSQSHPWIVSAPPNPEWPTGGWQRAGVAVAKTFWQALALATESGLRLRLGPGVEAPMPPAGKTWREILGPRFDKWEKS